MANAIDKNTDTNDQQPPIVPTWKKARFSNTLRPGLPGGKRIGVDRKAKCIFGVIMAQEGPFKSDGRGEFTTDAIRTVADLAAKAPNGLKCRWTHPDVSNDGLGKFLGRLRDPWLDTITERESYGELKTDPVLCCRADLYFDETAQKTPPQGGRPFADYLMDLAESDPDAFSTSLVLRAEEEYRLNPDGTLQKDENGDPLPPLWTPIALHACDCVDTGDAVDGALSANLATDGLPDAVVRQAAVLMETQFSGKTPEFIRARCLAWLDRYLSRQFGVTLATDEDVPSDEPEAAHDGCRSKHGLHYQKECRKCGTTIASCGCKDRLKESRVIRMGLCEACSKPDEPATPTDEPEVPVEQPLAYDDARDPRKLRIKLEAEKIGEVLDKSTEK